uniref:Chaperonin containing T-complex polypeptide subunit zeta n=1 Tax=Hirondellea gigas TaxID=1518452 RepID=A0A2P2I3C5_9CRUS
MALKSLNPQADFINHAIQVNVSAAQGLMNVLKTNLGPHGTLKMLVSGAGDVKLTKDGCVLLNQMQIQHPTASLIARTATAQDDITGDGTTSSVLFVGELLRQSIQYIAEGLHPRVLTEGIEYARLQCLDFLKGYKTPFVSEGDTLDREFLCNIARCSLRTKVHEELADHLTDIVVDATLCIQKSGKPIDLHMVEIMFMEHQTALDSTLVRGLVLDHGARHPDMSKRSTDCFILTCNISLEYEKTEVNSGFFYSSAAEREAMVKAERAHVDDKVNKIIDLKNSVCEGTEKSFVVINQKGIDPVSLDMFQKNGIVGIRRAKRRNMERLSLACGGFAVNAVRALSSKALGHADLVYEHTLGEDKYTFVEGVKNAQSCTILIKGPNKHTIAQVKEALRDGLRAVTNAIEDKAVVRGAGAFEIACHIHLKKLIDTEVKGRMKLGVQAFADAMLVIPKVLVENAGLDRQEVLISVLEDSRAGRHVGVDLTTGGSLLPEEEGIWDCYRAKRQIFHLGAIIATKLLLVDAVMRAGKLGSGE